MDPRVLRSWQYRVTGKVAAAAVLHDLKAEHLQSGGALGGGLGSSRRGPRTMPACTPDQLFTAPAPAALAAGGPRGIEQKACKEIARRNLDDTFYVVDLGNVTRLYKVNARAGGPPRPAQAHARTPHAPTRPWTMRLRTARTPAPPPHSAACPHTHPGKCAPASTCRQTLSASQSHVIPRRTREAAAAPHQ